MRYLSLFSGIEAATAAWQSWGWECVGASEIDAFPCEVLKQRHPNIHNLGDIKKITQEKLDELGTVDIVVGGSPCQSFSTAGKREGLADDRGQLMLEYIRVVDAVRPKWFIWENVPGVLSSNNGRDFGTLIRKMADIGYSLCWRVLDAQYFGVPQRRRRVYLVGHIGADSTCSTKVLFDPQSRSRNYKESEQKRKEVTSADEASTYSYDVYVKLLSDFLDDLGLQTHYTQSGFSAYTKAYGTLSASDWKRPEQHIVVANDKIRRLTPLECERLQGFPDNYTRIEWRGKPEDQCPDGHSYKALGNSMAVPVMRWIGHNIQQYDERYYLPW